MQETFIISLGGSLIVPEEIDTGFLKEFKELILSQIAEGKKFVIITGGGDTCRRYDKAAEGVASISSDDLDWIGIASLRLNAELVRVIFGKDAHSEVIRNLTEDFSMDKPVTIGSAFKPGHSSDWNAVAAAKKLGAKKVVNLSNIDYVYDSDPKKNPNAKKLESISWKEYRAIIPKEWTPGMNTPFDPVASEMAEESGIEVAIMNGKPLENFANYLNGEKFHGTVIK